MKGMKYVVTGILVLLLAMGGAAWAATSDEKTLDKDSATIDKTASTSMGQKAVVGKIEKEFPTVTDTQIQALRDKKQGYGEITIVLSLASKMPGGLTQENIDKVMALRQGPPVTGWGEIAKKLDMKLGPTVSAVKSVSKDASAEAKREAGKGEGKSMETHGSSGDHGGMSGHEGIGGEGMSHGRGR